MVDSTAGWSGSSAFLSTVVSIKTFGRLIRMIDSPIIWYNVCIHALVVRNKYRKDGSTMIQRHSMASHYIVGGAAVLLPGASCPRLNACHTRAAPLKACHTRAASSRRPRGVQKKRRTPWWAHWGLLDLMSWYARAGDAPVL